MYKLEITDSDLKIYAVSAIITCYIHYFGAMMIGFELLYLFLISLSLKDYTKKIFLTGYVIFQVLLIWLVMHFCFHTSFLQQVSEGEFWIKKLSLQSYIMLINFIFNKKLILLLFIPVFFNFKAVKQRIFSEIRENKLASPILSLSYLTFAPILLVSLISIYYPLFYPRYFIVILPSFYLLTSILISYNPFFDNIKSNILVLITCLASLLLFLYIPGNSILRFSPFYSAYKQQYRESVEYITQNYGKKSIIFVNRSPVLFSYYIDRFTKKKIDIEYIDKLKSLKLNKYNRIFILSSFTKISAHTKSYLAKNHFNYKIKKFTDIYLYDCSRKSDSLEPSNVIQ